MPNLSGFPIGERLALPAIGGWPETVHVFDEQSANAIAAAIAAERPLLIRGDPGTGKSQLARAAAHQLKRLFVSHVVNARSESEELQYHFDTVARLGEAQARSLPGAAKEENGSHLEPRRFLSPGPLWWVFDWESAEAQHTHCLYKRRRPAPPNRWQQEDGAVLLIDEIDKADADLPNGLLETLGNGAFSVPWRNEAVGQTSGKTPLIIITTNQERELPDAFVRRCLVLSLELPKEVEAFKAFLVKRGAYHFGDDCNEAVRQEAAKQVWEDRENALALGVTPPGQAEYLDILRAVVSLSKETDLSQEELLESVSLFALKKHE